MFGTSASKAIGCTVIYLSIIISPLTATNRSMEMELPTLLRNYDRPTEGPTDKSFASNAKVSPFKDNFI